MQATCQYSNPNTCFVHTPQHGSGTVWRILVFNSWRFKYTPFVETEC